MSVELIKDSLKLDQVVGENIAQTIVEGDILVPDTKPDITRVLSAEAKAELNRQEIEDEKISVEGTVYFKILYVSEKGEQPLYSVDSSTEFSQYIEIENINSTMKSEVVVEVEHTDFTINNERKIGVKAVINLSGKGIEEKTIEITKDITGLDDIQVLKESYNYTDIVGINESETLVRDNFELDEDEYEIEEILKWDATVLHRETKITDGKVIVSGIVNVELLYVDDEYNNQLKIIKREIPFTHFVEIAHAFNDMESKLNFSIVQLYYDVKENLREEKKIVEIEAIVNVIAKVVDTQSREILIDTYSPSKDLEITKEQIELSENMGINRANVLIREALDLPEGHPPVSEVFSVNVNPILTDYDLAQGNVIVEGILEATVMYKAIEGVQPLYSFTEEVPFRHYIEYEDATEDMELEVDLFIEEVDYSVVNGEQVEIKVGTGAVWEAYCTKYIDIISAVEELEDEEDPKDRPSLTIYYMQPGDTLWNLAKTYHTTVGRIMETNQIEDPAVIKTGDHIIIEKVHSFDF